MSRREALALLGFSAEEPAVTGGNGDDDDVAGFPSFAQTLRRGRVRSGPVIMAETLMAGTAAVEAVGTTLGIDMADLWEADTAFFDLIRNREVLTRMVAEIAGERVAAANAAEKTKMLKATVRAHVDGEDGRQKVERCLPRWMRFAPSAYTKHGVIDMVGAASKVEAARAVLDEVTSLAIPRRIALIARS